MSFYLDKKIIANSREARGQHAEIMHRRKAFDKSEEHLAGIHGLQTNAAARIPQDVFRDFDNQTKQLMTGDEGGVIIDALMPLARSVSVGKIVSEYRRVSDASEGHSSISGQHRKPTDKVTYDYDGALILIHDAAVSREWRELEAMRSEDFDALIDDQAAATRAARRQMLDNFLNGSRDANGDPIVYKGRTSYGIKNSPNTQQLDLGTSGLAIDLTASTMTYSEAESVFLAVLRTLQGAANNVDMDITFYVSSEIWFNLLRRGTNEGDWQTFLEALRKIPGVADIRKTNGQNALSGNEFLAYAASGQFLQPVVGMAMTTTPMQRLTPYADWNALVWTAAGLQVKADVQGRSGVLYASEVT